MKISLTISKRFLSLLLFLFIEIVSFAVFGQGRPRAAAKRGNMVKENADTIPPNNITNNDSIYLIDSIAAENAQKMQRLKEPITISEDSIQQKTEIKVPKFVPNPTKATWMAIVIPGGGQIYNRKYWKLPIFYGGFAGCAYALSWNNSMYKDYQNAYKDAVYGNWDSTNITDLLPTSYLSRVSQSQITELLRKRKDTYRRYRDMSIFAFVAVYLLSIVDAYVDAELSNFDLSPDLSVHIEPAVINSNSSHKRSQNLGIQCCLHF